MNSYVMRGNGAVVQSSGAHPSPKTTEKKFYSHYLWSIYEINVYLIILPIIALGASSKGGSTSVDDEGYVFMAKASCPVAHCNYFAIAESLQMVNQRYLEEGWLFGDRTSYPQASFINLRVWVSVPF